MTSLPTPSHDKQPAGSPDQGEPVFLVVGRLRRPHGVHGEMVMEVLTDFPDRLQTGRLVYVGENYQELRVQRSRPHNQGLLISFKGYDTSDEVGELRNLWVYVRSDEIPALEEGEYYHHQVIGLRAVAEDGELLGKIVEILETGANDVYVIRGSPHGQILVPAVDAFVLSVDLTAGEVRIRLISGMKDN